MTAMSQYTIKTYLRSNIVRNTKLELSGLGWGGVVKSRVGVTFPFESLSVLSQFTF